jgi:hypothetical protein
VKWTANGLSVRVGSGDDPLDLDDLRLFDALDLGDHRAAFALCLEPGDFGREVVSGLRLLRYQRRSGGASGWV